jgi:methionyl-tRNA synthetase
MENFYITTPIYYVNDAPHIGHAYTTIACDAMARYHRLLNHSVKFTTGTDEHGQKVYKAARDSGIDPQLFTDEVSKRFRELVATGSNILNVTNNDFIRTTEDRHKKAAQQFWKRIKDNGFIYLGAYSGWYSVRDEAYFQESELVDGKAPTGAPVEWVEEQSYFFKLSAFQDKLLEFYEKNPDFIIPASRYNEVVSFVRGGRNYEQGALKDLSISRTSFDWGIKVPDDESHIMYVWIDALTNYLTSAGFPDTDSTDWLTYWGTKEKRNCTHVVGKDILRFHAVYWPAFLMAAELPLPKQIVAHGWWTIEGEKMSKSLGNVLTPHAMIKEAGSIDALRYFMLRAMSFGNDGDFSKARLNETVNAELSNNIGNLAQRTLSLIQKNCNGSIPQPDGLTSVDESLFQKVREFVEKYHENMKQYSFREAIEQVIGISSLANEYINSEAPWKLKNDNPKRMNTVLHNILKILGIIGILIQPFTPDAADKLLTQSGIKPENRSFLIIPKLIELTISELSEIISKNLPAPEGIFPRIVSL